MLSSSHFFALKFCLISMWILLLFSILIAVLGPSESVAHDPSAYGGLFRSSNNGASWLPADAGLFLSAAIGVAINPVDVNHLLLATDTGLLRSRNGGRNWVREAPTVLFGGVYAVAFDAEGLSALASTASGIYRTDDGHGWQKILAPEGASPAYAIVPGSVAGRMYVAGPGGLWRSDDRGRSWSGAGESLPEGAVNSLLVITKPKEFLYAVTGGRLWTSTDGARTWRARDAGLPQGRVEALAQDPMEPDCLWVAAADRVFESRDGGLSWYAVGVPLPETNTSVRGIATAEGGQIMVLTTHRGLFRSTDGGRSWSLMEGNLPVHLEAGPLVRDPANPSTLYAGFALTPYTELWKVAMEGGTLLSRVDPLSLVGGGAFLILLMVLGILAVRWLARSRSPAAAMPARSRKIKEILP